MGCDARHGELAVDHTFERWGAGGGGASYLGKVSTTCTPAAVAFGTGCVGGATFYHQVVPVEFGSTIDITAVTSTNGLALTVGRF